MSAVYSWLQNNMFWLQACLLVLFIITVIFSQLQSRKQRQLIYYYRTLMAKYGESDLETILQQVIAREDRNEKSISALTVRVNDLEKAFPRSLSRFAIIRYKAFPDVGGDQSFSLAILDDGGNGFVMTGIHGRDDARVYAKPISEFKSEHVLSDEEKQVIQKARENR